MRPKRPGVVTVKELARIQKTTARTVRRWIASGLPVVQRGGRGSGVATLLDTAVVTEWRAREVKDEAAMTASLIGKLDARARAAVRRLRVLQDTHIEHSEAVQAWTEQVGRVRAHTATFASDVTTVVLAGSPDVGTVRRALKTAATDVLRALAADDVYDAHQVPVHTVVPSKTLRAARAQLATIETLVLDYRDGIAAGAYRSADAVTDDWLRRVNAFRARMLGLPGTCADETHRAALLNGPTAVEVVLAAALAGAVAELEPRPA